MLSIDKLKYLHCHIFANVVKSIKEIAEILSVSNRGVEQHRYRIKKKLKLSGDLSIFLQSL